MDIYNAFMKAAGHIEKHPELFNYCTNNIPKQSCGSPGCALGWVAYYLGMSGTIEKTIYSVLGFHSIFDFSIERMDPLGIPGWRQNADACAEAMRRYAAKYHAPAKVVQPPDWNAIASRQTVGEYERSQELA